MIITHRPFIIPESEEELQILSKSKHLEKGSLTVCNKVCTYFTTIGDDVILLSEYFDNIRTKYSFNTIKIKNQTKKEFIVQILKIKPEIILDARKETLEYNFDMIKTAILEHGIQYRWSPTLSQKYRIDSGILEMSNLLQRYHKFLIISNRRLVLERVKNALIEYTEITPAWNKENEEKLVYE